MANPDKGGTQFLPPGTPETDFWGNPITLPTDGSGNWVFPTVTGKLWDLGGAGWNIKAFGAKGDGITDDSAAITKTQAAIPASGGKILVGEGSFVSASAIPPDSNMTWEGEGQGSQLLFTGSGRFMDFSVHSATQVKFRDLRISGNLNGTWTLFYLNNVFRNSWHGCIIDGTHSAGTQRPNQTGFELLGNAGDNRISDCDLNNLGNAILTATIMNYLSLSIVGTCNFGVAGYGANGAFAAGMSIAQCTFVSSAAATTCHVKCDVDGNKWWISDTWMEGCTTACQWGDLATSTHGPYSVKMSGVLLAATTADLLIYNALYTLLESVTFDHDGGQTPTELSISTTGAVEGTAINLRSIQSFDFASSIFPTGWTVIRRGAMRFPQLIDGNSAGVIMGGLAAGTTGGYPWTAASNNANDVPLKVITNAIPAVDLFQVYSGGTKALWMDNNQAFHTNAAIQSTSEIYPGTDAFARQTACGLLAGTGAPSNANGNNGDVYFRSDGGALTTIYQKRTGAWVAVA